MENTLLTEGRDPSEDLFKTQHHRDGPTQLTFQWPAVFFGTWIMSYSLEICDINLIFSILSMPLLRHEEI